MAAGGKRENPTGGEGRGGEKGRKGEEEEEGGMLEKGMQGTAGRWPLSHVQVSGPHAVGLTLWSAQPAQEHPRGAGGSPHSPPPRVPGLEMNQTAHCPRGRREVPSTIWASGTVSCWDPAD